MVDQVADALEKIKSMTHGEQEEIINRILVLPNEDKQIEMIYTALVS